MGISSAGALLGTAITKISLYLLILKGRHRLGRVSASPQDFGPKFESVHVRGLQAQISVIIVGWWNV